MEHFLLEMLTNQIIKYIPLQQGLRPECASHNLFA